MRQQFARGVALRACWVLPIILAGSFGRPRGVLGVALNTLLTRGILLLLIANMDVSRHILVSRYIYNFI
jgi:hypothetical protein